MNTMVESEVEVTGELGLHARPAAEFAAAAARYTSDVRIAKGAKEVDAKSVLLVLTLDVRHGDHVTLRARGDDADRAVTELSELVGAQ